MRLIDFDDPANNDWLVVNQYGFYARLDLHDEASKLVLEQAEVLCADWAV